MKEVKDAKKERAGPRGVTCAKLQDLIPNLIAVATPHPPGMLIFNLTHQPGITWLAL